MRKIAFLLVVLSCSIQSKAQKDSVDRIFAFKITDYMKPLNDSTILVQVLKPAAVPVNIKDKQVAVMRHCFKQGSTLDTATIGWGRCQLVKGEYYYFGIHKYGSQAPSEGDLLYANLKLPFVYDGLLLNVMNHALQFTDVYGVPFMNSNAVFTNTKKNEADLLDSMVKDIRFTGSAMLQQMPEQNQAITSGIYKGQKVFAAMQVATSIELQSFLKYVAARPKKYAGNDWKISEVYATWMTSGTPTVMGD